MGSGGGGGGGGGGVERGRGGEKGVNSKKLTILRASSYL